MAFSFIMIIKNKFTDFKCVFKLKSTYVRMNVFVVILQPNIKAVGRIVCVHDMKGSLMQLKKIHFHP